MDSHGALLSITFGNEIIADNVAIMQGLIDGLPKGD